MFKFFITVQTIYFRYSHFYYVISLIPPEQLHDTKHTRPLLSMRRGGRRQSRFAPIYAVLGPVAMELFSLSTLLSSPRNFVFFFRLVASEKVRATFYQKVYFNFLPI